jgi:Intein splicing domain/UvrD-like helicase C-terminal domain/AAA domain
MVSTPTRKAAIVPSPYQEAIFDHFAAPGKPSNLSINAVSGSGKTSSLKMLAKRLDGKGSQIYLAFNREIVQEVEPKFAPMGVAVKTFHGWAMSALIRQFGKVTLDDKNRKYRDLWDEAIGASQDRDLLIGIKKWIPSSCAVRILGLLRINCWGIGDIGFNLGVLRAVLDHSSIDLSECDPDWLQGNLGTLAGMFEAIIHRGAEKFNFIDFVDMLYLPAYYGIAMPHFDYYLNDEAQDYSLLMQYLLQQTRSDAVKVFVADPHQCLIKGTFVSRADGSRVPIERLKVGDLLSTNGGNGSVYSSPITDIYKKSYSGQIVTITLASGKQIESTPEHIHFAQFVHDDFTIENDHEKRHFVYLMYKHGYGFRVGITRYHRSGAKYKNFGFMQRLSQEGADKVWVLHVCNDGIEARTWEEYYSTLYGLPTICFKEVESIKSLFMTQDRIDWVFQQVPTVERGHALLKDLKMFFDYPHHKTGGFNRESIAVRIGVCKDGRFSNPLHQLSCEGSDNEIAGVFKTLGLPVTDRKDSRTGGFSGWRIRVVSKNLGYLYEIVAKLRSVAPVELFETMQVAKRSLDFCPASHVREGMLMYTTKGYEVVTDVSMSYMKTTVYDLNIDRTHNFCANGIYTHNSIYGFSGADQESYDRIKTTFNTKELPLSVCYRCPEKVIERAQRYVPHIQGTGKAGNVTNLSFDKAVGMLQPGDLYLSRTNAPLVKRFFSLVSQGVLCTIKGRDYYEMMSAFISTAEQSLGLDMREQLGDAYDRKTSRLDQDDPRRGVFTDVLDCLYVILEAKSDITTLAELKSYCSSMFTKEACKNGVTLSSIHRSKGLENGRVFLYEGNRGFAPPGAGQESNLVYVGLTRALDDLYIVERE